MTTALIERPELTMPEAEAALLRDAYAQADVILEYGSGGSTVMGAEMAGKTVYSIESDHSWAKMMRGYLGQNAPQRGTDVHVIWQDVGPTKRWGYPVDDSEWKRFARYPLQIWQSEGFRQPDVVLVDGRFRIGCALATLYQTRKPVTLYFDDYVDRKHYRRVEEFLDPPEITGRMAKFHITPTAMPPERLLQVITLMQRP